MKASLPRPRSWLFRVYGINARNMFVCANQSRRLFHGVRIILAHAIHPFFCLVLVISKNDLCFVFFKWSLDSNFAIGLSICEQRFILIGIELRISSLFLPCGAVVCGYEASIWSWSSWDLDTMGQCLGDFVLQLVACPWRFWTRGDGVVRASWSDFSFLGGVAISSCGEQRFSESRSLKPEQKCQGANCDKSSQRIGIVSSRSDQPCRGVCR